MAELSNSLLRFLRMLFAGETLPDAPPATGSSPRRGALHLLFAPEELPEDPPPPARSRGRWLAWLFAPERLDREG